MYADSLKENDTSCPLLMEYFKESECTCEDNWYFDSPYKWIDVSLVGFPETEYHVQSAMHKTIMNEQECYIMLWAMSRVYEALN